MNGADSYFWLDDPLPLSEREQRMYFIGVDPGVSGGIAVVDDKGACCAVTKMPDTDRELFNFFSNAASAWLDKHDIRAVLERAGASPQMGVTSAFTFGKNYGLVRMALIAASIPFDVITPQQWQKVMGCRSGGDKNITKARAEQLFPAMRVTHAIADALLLAEFCRRAERGSLNREPAGENNGKENTQLFTGQGEVIHASAKLDAEENLIETVTTRRRARASRRAD